MSDKFYDLLENVVEKAPRRIWAGPKGSLYDCVKSLKENHGFDHLGTITCVENGENFEILYHIAQDKTGNLLTVRDVIKIEGAKTKSITPLFQSAVWYEKEIDDLFGVVFEGLPQANRYPLPDKWPTGDHPLRKSWKPAECAPGQQAGRDKEDK
jgi:NADH:ubiquinone oxidoreductase subunit C